jgi:hypothetical protein
VFTGTFVSSDYAAASAQISTIAHRHGLAAGVAIQAAGFVLIEL